jgi:hypothetical protein
MPYAKQEWSRTPNSWTFDALSSETLGPVSVSATATTNATAQTIAMIPNTIKIAKVGVIFTSIAALSGASFNVVYNTNQTPGATLSTGSGTSAQYLTNGCAPNDNSFTGANPPGTSSNANSVNTALSVQPGGLGIPTNYAVDNQPLFASDITFNTTNFPGATTAGGGMAYFVPTNFDAVYPCGPVFGASGYTNVSGYFTLRVTNASGAIGNLAVTLFYAPITGKEKWGSATNTNSICTPGSTASVGDF